jgi:hypothetical protein
MQQNAQGKRQAESSSSGIGSSGSGSSDCRKLEGTPEKYQAVTPVDDDADGKTPLEMRRVVAASSTPLKSTASPGLSFAGSSSDAKLPPKKRASPGVATSTATPDNASGNVAAKRLDEVIRKEVLKEALWKDGSIPPPSSNTSEVPNSSGNVGSDAEPVVSADSKSNESHELFLPNLAPADAIKQMQAAILERRQQGKVKLRAARRSFGESSGVKPLVAAREHIARLEGAPHQIGHAASSSSPSSLSRSNIATSAGTAVDTDAVETGVSSLIGSPSGEKESIIHSQIAGAKGEDHEDSSGKALKAKKKASLA